MLRDILVDIPLQITTRDYAGEFALSLGGQFNAHVTGIVFDLEPALQPNALGVLPNHIMLTARAEMTRLAEAAKGRFEETAKHYDVSAQAVLMSAPFAEATQFFSNSARRFDLSIVGQPKDGFLSPESAFIEAALFDSGRPVVVIPYIHRGPPKLERIAVCWDGSRAAARALGDAMVFLTAAKSVDVVVVTTEEPKSNEINGADIAQHLARHQLPVTLRELADNTIDVGNTILNFAADHSIDLLVMGGYGHWRLREFILGGTTRTILNTMTVPVFISH